MFIGSGKGAQGSKDRGKKRGEREPEEVRSKEGAQGWAGSGGESGGPCHESSFVAAALGSPKFQRAASGKGHWPGPWRHSLPGLSPSQLQKLPSPGAGAPGPSPPLPIHPSRPRAGSHRVGCGGSVAGSERRQGDGGGGEAGPHSAPGAPAPSPGEA